jgi:hypothetical protein
MASSPDPYRSIFLPRQHLFSGREKKGPQKPDFCRWRELRGRPDAGARPPPLVAANGCQRGARTGRAGRRQISVNHATGTGAAPAAAAAAAGGIRAGTARPAVPDAPDGQAARERGPPPARGRRRAARHRARGDRRGRVVHPYPRHRRPARPDRAYVLGRGGMHRPHMRDRGPRTKARPAPRHRHSAAVVARHRARGGRWSTPASL